MAREAVSKNGLAAGNIRRRLLLWYAKHKRDLPWRRTRDPYRIWISEIMLQQTRVAAVIPYYERFLERFPDVRALASAPEQELLTAWAGLGYYSRARNLQKAAQSIVLLPQFPRDYDALRELAGVGDYTASAIASIAFGLAQPALDGNVLRVLSRLIAERGNIRRGPARKRLRAIAGILLDPLHPGAFNQALMELGAMVCLPKQPQCQKCPISPLCEARLHGHENQLPVRPSRPSPGRVEKHLMMIENRGRVLLWQRPAGSCRLAGFWELPEREQVPDAEAQGKLASFRHSIVNTNYDFQVYRALLRRVPEGFRWQSRQNLQRIPLSTVTKKALAYLGAGVLANPGHSGVP
jgi:A/G-specific adenine glycosylase